MELAGSKYNKAITAIFLLSVLCFLFSILIEVEKIRYENLQSGFCSALTGSDGCKVVQTSIYGDVFGIDNPIIGMAGFGSMAIISSVLIFRKNLMKRTKDTLVKFLIAGSFIAGLATLWFLYVQQFILHKYCLFCMFVDVFSLALAGIAVYLLWK